MPGNNIVQAINVKDIFPEPFTLNSLIIATEKHLFSINVDMMNIMTYDQDISVSWHIP